MPILGHVKYSIHVENEKCCEKRLIELRLIELRLTIGTIDSVKSAIAFARVRVTVGRACAGTVASLSGAFVYNRGAVHGLYALNVELAGDVVFCAIPRARN